MMPPKHDEPVGAGIEPRLNGMDALQRVLGCGKSTAFAIVGSGDIEAVQVGRKRMAIYASVKAYVERLREQAKMPKAA